MESLSLVKPRVSKTAPKLVRTNPEAHDGSIFNSVFRFDINKSDGNLLQQYLRIKITAFVNPIIVSPSPFIFNSQLGLDLLKSVSLVSERGIIQTIDKTTLIGRIGLIYKTSLYNRISPGIEGKATLLVSGQDFYIPLFWFFSDLTKDVLDVSKYNRLWVEAISESNVTNMGFGANVIVDKFTIELYSRFAQTVIGGKIESIPKQIESSYSSFIEHDTNVELTGGDEQTFPILLRCPYEVFYIHIYVPRIGGVGSATISNVKLVCPTSTLFDLNLKMNYILRSNESYDDSNDSAFSLWFGDRHGDFKDFITFGQEMTGTYLHVTVQSNLGGDYVIKTSCEYRTNLEINDGIITNKTMGSAKITS